MERVLGLALDLLTAVTGRPPGGRRAGAELVLSTAAWGWGRARPELRLHSLLLRGGTVLRFGPAPLE